MDISQISLINKIQLFLQNRWTLLWYAILAATFIPFFATDIEWKPLSELKLEDDAAAFLIMLLLSMVVFGMLLWSLQRKLSFYRRAKLTLGKGYADPNSLQMVRGFAKAYRVCFPCVIEGVEYQFTSGLITQVDFDKEYQFALMYDPLDPTHFKIISELPKSVSQNICNANGLSYEDP